MFLNVCKQTFHISNASISQRVSKRWFTVKSSAYFYLKTKMQADLQICISVPLVSYSWRYTSKKKCLSFYVTIIFTLHKESRNLLPCSNTIRSFFVAEKSAVLKNMWFFNPFLYNIENWPNKLEKQCVMKLQEF